MRAENPSYRRAARLRAALALVVGFVVFSDTSAVASPTTTTTPTTALAPVVEVVDEKTADATTAPEDETAAEAVDTAAATVEYTTTAAAAPAAAAVGLGWNGFSVNKWPSGSWRPYAANSPFNQVATTAAQHPNSARIVQRVLSLGSVGNLVAGNSGTTSDYGHPTYYAQPADPLFTLRWTGGGPGAAINGLRIRIPDAARPAAGGDGHLTVVQPDGWEYDFWRVGTKPKGGGTMTFAGGGRTRIDGNGLNSGATAANFGNLAGVIRAQELAAGTINHALFLVVKCVARGTSFGYGTRTTSSSSYVYPASHAGAPCSSDPGDLPPLGARLRLAMTTTQINALAIPNWKKTILRALSNYGGYIGDTGGPGLAFQFESSATYTSFGVADPLVAFAKANGVPQWNGTSVFNMASGVDWAKYLRVLVPPAVG